MSLVNSKHLVSARLVIFFVFYLLCITNFSIAALKLSVFNASMICYELSVLLLSMLENMKK